MFFMIFASRQQRVSASSILLMALQALLAPMVVLRELVDLLCVKGMQTSTFLVTAFLSFEPIRVPENQKVKDIFLNVGFLRVLNLEILTSPDKYGWSVIRSDWEINPLELPQIESILRHLLFFKYKQFEKPTNLGCTRLRFHQTTNQHLENKTTQTSPNWFWCHVFVHSILCICVGYWGFEESNIVTKHYPVEVNLPNIQTLETMDVCYWNPKWLCKVGSNIRRLAISSTSSETIDVLINKNKFNKLENLRLSN